MTFARVGVGDVVRSEECLLSRSPCNSLVGPQPELHSFRLQPCGCGEGEEVVEPKQLIRHAEL